MICNSCICNIYVFCIAPDGYPKNVSVGNISSESVILTWDPPQYSERNGVINRYDINLTDAELETIAQIVTTSAYIEISSLSPFTTYFTFVSASTSAGMGPFGTSLSFTTLEDGELCVQCVWCVYDNTMMLTIHAQHQHQLQHSSPVMRVIQKPFIFLGVLQNQPTTMEL